MSKFLDHITIVLVGTRSAGNISSTARAMQNTGLSRLKLVKPREHLTPDAFKMATRAVHLVEQARVYETLDEAVGEEQILVGTTSARDRQTHQRSYTPKQIAPIIREYAEAQKVALIFGPENRGLTDEQLALCQYLAVVPSHGQFPVLNVAQTVLLMAYEVYTLDPIERTSQPVVVSQEQREEMFHQMEEVLIRIGFLSSSSPEPIMKSIRRFLGKAELTARDVKIVRGIMSQMEWYSQVGHKLSAKRIRKP